MVKREENKYKKHLFYVIKDEFILRNDRNIARYVEHSSYEECPKCKATNSENCTCCNGLGYIPSLMCECQMNVAGLMFSLHSTLPRNEFTLRTRITEEDHSHSHKSNELPNLSLDGFLGMLSYVVIHIWGLDIDYGGEYPKIKSHDAGSGDEYTT